MVPALWVLTVKEAKPKNRDNPPGELVRQPAKQNALETYGAFLIRFIHCSVLDDETQLKTNGSISQQDIFGEKLSNEQKIAMFTKNDFWTSLFQENWEDQCIEDKHNNEWRHLRSHIVERLCESSKGNTCGETVSRIPNIKLYKKTPSGVKLYECSQCGKVFRHRSSLKRHKRSHTGRKLYQCEECGKAFSCSSYLRNHVKTHSGEKPYACKLCGKTFIRSHSLTGHIRSHTGEKPYECKQCGKAFSCPKSFRVHVMMHNGGKPYECKQCGKGFSCPKSFRVHMIMHTGEKPYECKQCGKAYCWLTSFQRHVRIHNGEKPYKCEKCGKAFGWPSSLHKHVRMHTEEKPINASNTREKPFKCEKCGKAFGWSSSLHKHVKKHSGEKPIIVSNAGKPSNGPHPYKTIRMQTREKPHICEKCGKTFSCPKSLHSHTTRHLGAKPNSDPHCCKSSLLTYTGGAPPFTPPQKFHMAAMGVRGRSNGSPVNSARYCQPGNLDSERIRPQHLPRVRCTQADATPTAVRMRTPHTRRSHVLAEQRRACAVDAAGFLRSKRLNGSRSNLQNPSRCTPYSPPDCELARIPRPWRK
ncbi:hypothetical protein GH733_003885 [Mirounga leonina]|nr:hypothetical protein GH733_003885 [Mirounga leonina]